MTPSLSGPNIGEARIGFAIPYYEDLGYLGEAIASVQAQTVSDWELVVVDDAGPEPAHGLVAQLNDPRVRYVRNVERRGLPGNWNECIAQTTTPLVTLVHADDRLLPSYAERVLAAADEHESAAAYFTGVRVMDAEGQPSRTYVDLFKKLLTRDKNAGVVVGDTGLASLVAGNFIYCPTLALRRDFIGPAPFDESWQFVCDWEFSCRLLLEGHALVGVAEPLLEYRRHAAQTTARLTVDARRFSEELRFLDLMTVRATEQGFREAARSARHRLLTRGHVAVSASLDLLRGQVRPARLKSALLWRDLVGTR